MRLKPLPPEQLAPDRRALHDEIVRGINAHLSSFTSARSDGALTDPFPPMLHFPEFGKAAWANAQALIENSKLPSPRMKWRFLRLAPRSGLATNSMLMK